MDVCSRLVVVERHKININFAIYKRKRRSRSKRRSKRRRRRKRVLWCYVENLVYVVLYRFNQFSFFFLLILFVKKLDSISLNHVFGVIQSLPQPYLFELRTVRSFPFSLLVLFGKQI